MARKNNTADFTDIEDAPLPNAAFANNPMPPQELIDQAASAGPELTPEQKALMPARPRKSAARHAESPRLGFKPMGQIIDEFMQQITGHPDCNLLGSEFGGKPTQATEFPHTPRNQQRVVKISLVWRDPNVASEAYAEQKVALAYEPGGRYYDLIPKRGQEDVAEPTGNDGPKSWDHLVKKAEKTEPVEAGA